MHKRLISICLWGGYTKYAAFLGGFCFLVCVCIGNMYWTVRDRHVIKSLSMNTTVPERDVRQTGREFKKLNLLEEKDTFAKVIRFSVPDNGRQCKDRKFMIYTCKSMCGGWGDRLKGITTLFLLAQLTNRTFLIDMPRPCNLHTLVIPHLYDWIHCLDKAKNFNSSEIIHQTLMSGISSKKIDDMLYGKMGEYKVISVQTNTREFQTIKLHNTARNAIPWIHKLTEAEVTGSIIGMLFRSSRRIADALLSFKTEKVRGRGLVCGHIRYGKNPTIPNDNHLHQGPPNVSRVLKFLKTYDQTDSNVIFVATDSAEIRNESHKLFTNFVSTDKNIIHVDRQSGGEPGELCDGFSAVLLDQLILSKCDVLVLTRSNFGAMAAYMRGYSQNLFLNVNTESHIFSVNVTDIQNIYKFV